MKLSLSAITLLLLTTSIALAEQPVALRAGAVAVDVTPTQFPLNMPGGFNANMAESAHDPLHARAMVLDDGTTQLAMVVVDSLGVSPEVIKAAKRNASRKTGIPASRMLVCSTHSHSCPSSGVTDGPAPAVAYRQQLLDGIARSIIDAHAKLQPASVGAAAHPLAEEVFNRRWHLKPGKMPVNPFGRMDIVKMNPPRSPGVLDRPAGPTDPDITVISVLNAKRKPLALFANYALHYVGAIPRGQVSADYFGEFSRLMPTRLRADNDFVAMMSNGASGDINNIPFTVTRPPREPFEQCRIVARKAADTAWFAQKRIEQHRSDVSLGMVQREVELRYRRPTDEELAYAKQVLSTKDEQERAQLPRLAEAYARRTMNAAQRKENTVVVTLQAIRIGDIAVCGIPFETIVEIGLELKERSPFPQTMVIGLANGRYGYLPTPEQHRLGGYETWLGTNHVQKDASVILVDNLTEMLDELHATR
ncbi:MAG: hypothetical protein ACYTGL_00065 [Planctomycetota bacterium]|jgi:hypothetical protein